MNIQHLSPSLHLQSLAYVIFVKFGWNLWPIPLPLWQLLAYIKFVHISYELLDFSFYLSTFAFSPHEWKLSGIITLYICVSWNLNINVDWRTQKILDLSFESRLQKSVLVLVLVLVIIFDLEFESCTSLFQFCIE